MTSRIERTARWADGFLSKRLSTLSRLWILVGVVLIGVSFFFPLWQINLVAPQYPDGLDLWMYGHQLAAGNDGRDLVEINILNNYIGMEHIHEADFVEMTVIPFVLGVFILFGLRAVVFGTMRALVDHVVLFIYFSLFSLANFAYQLYSYGQNLDPTAPMNVEPFIPALIGTKQIANMTQTSLPHVSSFLLAGALVAFLLAVYFSRNEPTALEAASVPPGEKEQPTG